MENPTPTEVAAPVVADKKVRKIMKPRAAKAVKPAPKVVVAKAKPIKMAEPKQAKEPMVNVHRAAGVAVGMYTGPSEMVNANRKTKVRQLDDLPTGKMTDRMKQSLYALRGCYDGRAFTVRGFDNGIIAHLAAAKMIALKGGAIDTIDGHEYLLDSETPVVANVTAAGKAYGKT